MVSYARNHNGQALEGAENVTVQYHDTIDENIQVGDVLWMSGHVGLYVGKSEDGSFMTVDHGGSGADLNCSLASGDGWTGPKYRDGSFFTGYIHYEGIPSLATTGGTGVSSGEFLITSGYKKDNNYKGTTYKLTNSERAELEKIVTGEYGGDYEGSVLVAQCLRDSLVNGLASSPMTIKKDCGYDGYNTNITENAKNAIKYVFDEGGSAIQHRIYVFYAPNICSSAWHESQNFIYQYNKNGCVRFFDYWN